jgi:plastocyanin
MRRLIVALVALVALMGACSSDDTASDVAATAAPATSEPAGTPAASDAMTAGGECQDATEAEGQADLEMQDFVFAPPCLEISTAQGLRIHNEGSVEHNFSVQGFAGLDVDVEPGDENNTEPTGLDPGTYQFFCKYHRDSKGMKGKLVVKSP